MILIAILFPGLSFLLRGKLLSALVAIVLQIVAILTFLLFGAGALLWAILAVWAVASHGQAKKERRHRQILRAMRRKNMSSSL